MKVLLYSISEIHNKIFYEGWKFKPDSIVIDKLKTFAVKTLFIPSNNRVCFVFVRLCVYMWCVARFGAKHLKTAFEWLAKTTF